jgi:hypothetical protein
MPILNDRALKCTVVLDPAEVAQLVAPEGMQRVAIEIRLPDTDRQPRRQVGPPGPRQASTAPTALR